jgi:hypothetical protein
MAGYTISATAYLSLNETPEMLLLQNEKLEYLDKHSLLAGFNTFWGHKAGSFYLNTNREQMQRYSE